MIETVVLYSIDNPRLLHSVEQLSSTQVRKITIEVEFEESRRFQNSQYEPVVECLAKDDFRCLKEVVFRYNGHLTSCEVTAKLRRVFRSVASKGMLRVETLRRERESPA